MLPTQQLVRRGLEAYNSASQYANEDPTQNFQMPVWGVVLLVLTIVSFLLGNFILEYTFGKVIPTLLMVESPQAIVFEPLSSEDPDAKLDTKGDVEPELLLVKQQPITASFRSTLKHLRARAGKRSHLRGLGVHAVNGLALNWSMNILASFLPKVLALPIATIICAPLGLAWTHIVISDPSPLPWYKRLPTFAAVKKIVGPTAIYALAKEAVFVLPAYLAISYSSLNNINSNMTKHQATVTCLQALSVVVLACALGFLVFIPANVTLTRVQASLLAENAESIVPFDRTFGGRVPENGVLGTLDAWRTFDWNSRVRLLKAYFKVVAIEIAFVMFFFGVLVAEAFLILGENRKKIVIGRDDAGNPRYLFGDL